MTRGIFTPEHTPIAYPGEYLRLDFGDRQEFRRITQINVLPEVDTEEITVAAGDRERAVEIDNLDIWDGWLGHYRFPRLPNEVPDDVEIRFDLAGDQAPLYQTKNVQGTITSDTTVSVAQDGETGEVETTDIGHLLELFVLGDRSVRFTVENYSSSEVNIQLTASGFKYNVEEVSGGEAEDPYYVPVRSIRGET